MLKLITYDIDIITILIMHHFTTLSKNVKSWIRLITYYK